MISNETVRQIVNMPEIRMNYDEFSGVFTEAGFYFAPINVVLKLIMLEYSSKAIRPLLGAHPEVRSRG